MSLDNVLKRRALRLKSELSEDNHPKPGILSTIYPAMDYGKNMPHVVKTPSSIPASNDGQGVEAAGEPEKGQKEVDEPGPSKTTSFSQPACPGQGSAVPPAHKKAAFDLGYFGEGRSERFINRCVELITGVKKVEEVEPEAGQQVLKEKPEEKKKQKQKINGLRTPDITMAVESNDPKARLSAVVKKFIKTKKANPDSHE